MAKKKIERLSVIHRREIIWLKWYYSRDKNNPSQTVLERKIKEAFKAQNKDKALFYVNLKSATDRQIATTPANIVEAIKKVFVYEELNVVGAGQRILFLGHTASYKLLNRWFDDYFQETYRHLHVKD